MGYLKANKKNSRESSLSGTSLRFKIKNELKESDYKRLAAHLKDNQKTSVELLTSLDFDFVSISAILVTVEGSHYTISAEISFAEPKGFEIYDELNPNDEMRSILLVNRKNFKLSKTVVEEADFEKDLNTVLEIIERIINYVSNKFGKIIDQASTINSDRLDKQLDMLLKKEELEKRGEVPSLFGSIHAMGLKDAKERAGNFVPIYLERDKAYLYEDKKVFMLLPRDFVMKLLKLEGATMIGADQFNDEEREALKKLSVRQYVKARKVGGKIYYADLDEKTRKLLLQGMRKAYTWNLGSIL
jgi:hypothetical protein